MTQNPFSRSAQFAFKATAETKNWSGYGYGSTPQEAARSCRRAMPSRVRRLKVRSALICARKNHENGTWDYPNTPECRCTPAVTAGAFRNAGARI